MYAILVFKVVTNTRKMLKINHLDFFPSAVELFPSPTSSAFPTHSLSRRNHCINTASKCKYKFSKHRTISNHHKPNIISQTCRVYTNLKYGFQDNFFWFQTVIPFSTSKFSTIYICQLYFIIFNHTLVVRVDRGTHFRNVFRFLSSEIVTYDVF